MEECVVSCVDAWPRSICLYGKDVMAFGSASLREAGALLVTSNAHRGGDEP